MAEDWKTWPFRQKMIQQLEELIRQLPPNQLHNAQNLELQVFQRSQKREEYVQFITRVSMYLRDLATNSNQQNNNPHSQAVLLAPGPNPQMAGPGTHMAGTVTQMAGPAGTMAGSVGPGPGQMVNAGGSVVAGPNANMMAGQQPMQGNPRMGQPMPPTVPNQTGDMSGWAGNNRRMNDMQQMTGNKKQPNITINQLNQPGKMNPVQMGIPGQGGPTGQMGQVPTQIVPNVGRATGTMQPRVPSPGFLVGMPRQGTPSASASPVPSLSAPSNQPSPAFISPSPSMVPSPGGMGRGAGQLGASPSPSGMLNTPGQPQQPSPAQCVSNSQVDDAAYREKVRELSKYIEPLRRVIERIGNEDVEKSRKMKQLYEILRNPQRRMSMETLKKCEDVLKRLEIKEEDGTAAPPSMENRIASLVDAVNNAFKHSWGSHTVHRTFSPALSVLLGPTYSLNPTKKFKRTNPLQPPPETPNISDIVQGEVARLNTRFRVNLDCQQPPGSDDLTLICQLDDPNLPCVPPITLTIPSAYPMKTPRCDLLPVDYETTDFLKNIRESMLVRLKNMPPHCSLTMMLHSWEMSVRQACAPKPSLTSIIANSLVTT